ncbi:DUF2515 family protein [Paenibacillus sp. 1P07SE]|uniref:DUF2515 family protein n=1 Tax=Paenibacillus sp. 1P07SE TaxID=3132209 RepID=UPI0039A5919A
MSGAYRHRSRGQYHPRSWGSRIAGWPVDLYRYCSGKWDGWRRSARLRRSALPLPSPDRQTVRRLAADWQRVRLADGGVGADPSAHSSLLADIRQRTARANRNNVTRTAAYLAFYRRHPEVHWSLLAHMVSRNGGWNMTDLQGELLPRLLTPEQCLQTFLMLERANYLIFGDAYPQLLLYEAGLAAGRDLSRLLPELGVSRFMEPVWAGFYRRPEPALLTTALIINEQQFIESRVVRHPFYREHVLERFYFALQAVLQFNQVMFPYGGPAAMAGLILEDFEDIRERIAFGKRLYALLFRIPEIHQGVCAFVSGQPHTGSRADYAPQLFTATTSMGQHPGQYVERLRGRHLLRAAPPLYSPRLADAWPDRTAAEAEPGDWLDDADIDAISGYMAGLPLPRSFAIANEYGFALDKLELAVLAKQTVVPASKAD